MAIAALYWTIEIGVNLLQILWVNWRHSMKPKAYLWLITISHVKSALLSQICDTLRDLDTQGLARKNRTNHRRKLRQIWNMPAWIGWHVSAMGALCTKGKNKELDGFPRNQNTIGSTKYSARKHRHHHLLLKTRSRSTATREKYMPRGYLGISATRISAKRTKHRKSRWVIASEEGKNEPRWHGWQRWGAKNPTNEEVGRRPPRAKTAYNGNLLKYRGNATPWKRLYNLTTIRWGHRWRPSSNNGLQSMAELLPSPC